MEVTIALARVRSTLEIILEIYEPSETKFVRICFRYSLFSFFFLLFFPLSLSPLFFSLLLSLLTVDSIRLFKSLKVLVNSSSVADYAARRALDISI